MSRRGSWRGRDERAASFERQQAEAAIAERCELTYAQWLGLSLDERHALAAKHPPAYAVRKQLAEDTRK